MKKIIIGVVALLAVITLSQSIVITREDEYSVVKQFGKIKNTRTEAGISFKVPFIQSTQKIPSNILLYDLSTSDVITKDKKTMITDSYVTWQISDPVTFAQTLNASVTNAESRIDIAVYNAMKTIIGSMSQNDLITSRDGELSTKVFSNIGSTMNQYGIRLLTVETKHLDLPDSNKEAVYERMISERENIATTYTAEGNSEANQIKNTTNNEINVMLSNANLKADKLIAEGEAEYMKILEEAYSNKERSDFYSYVRSLDAAKQALSGSNKTLILSKDSPIAQIFYQD
ncbi:protease modulator HflC [Anaerosporobacter sp.]|uniref:protease modulator HflC n=1 Tax=Anaerosporobacter sp. TaxID=1872529 RepID=UPI00286F5C21|nr:protease modulator HflC [Anaerosporobacter sp.]